MLIRQTVEKTSEYASAKPEAAQQTVAAPLATILREEEADRLLAQLRKQGRRRRKLATAQRALKWTIIPNTAVGFVSFLVNLARGGGGWLRVDWHDWGGIVSTRTAEHGERVVSFGGAWIVLTLATVFCLLAVQLLTRRQIRLSRELPHVNDLRAVGPLTEALALGDSPLREEAVPALIPLLCSLRSTDSELLPQHTHEILHEELLSGPQELREAILMALERVGIAQDAEVLETIAKDENRSLAPDFAAAVKECAEAIRRRLAADREKDQLLRPARSEDAEAVLLRAAPSHTEADPATLLRASE